MKNVTITVDDPVLEWARIEAARRGSSVSRMVGDFLGEMQRREDAYERAYLAWRTDERTWRSRPQGDGTAAICGFGRTRAEADASGGAMLQRTLAQPVFVDTAVLLAAEDGCDAPLHNQVRAALDLLWRERAGRVSSLVLAEFYETATCRAAPPMPPSGATTPGRPGRWMPPRWRRPGPSRRGTSWPGATACPWPPRSTAAAPACCR